LYAGLDDALAIGSNLTWQEALWAGLFDGAYCRVWRAYLTDPFTTVVGTSTLFYGRIGDVEIGRTKTIIRVKSLLDLLTTQMPKRLFQSACSFDFGDARCGYDRVNGISGLGITTGIGQVLINCLPGSDQNSILTSFAPTPSTAYDNGSIVGTSGLNTGFTRTIGQLSGGTIYYLKPWIFPVAAGDGFQLLPGCPHTLAYCTSPLQNQLADGTAGKYGGFPYIPPPETAV
ncbi:MAG TPA: DUF2163 domain-containing protein, partial [Stellaceae bacterium]|nr:DUF2163 domain-containing protein [Stellaceae bacterium]